jgi:hypothetical protein
MRIHEVTLNCLHVDLNFYGAYSSKIIHDFCLISCFFFSSMHDLSLIYAIFSVQGYILTSEIDGTIQMKSYLSGNPEIRLALNEDLSIGRGGERSIHIPSGNTGYWTA